MRLHRLAVLGVVTGISIVAVACGLESGGLLDAPDATVPDSGRSDVVVIDVAVPDVFVPPACTTLDASCLPPFPANAGWKPIAIPTSGGCPADTDAGAWTTANFVTDASLVPGSCNACTCTTNSAPCQLDATVTVYNSGSPNCAVNPVNSYVVSAEACDPNGFGNSKVTLKYAQPPASSCDASAGGDAQVATAPVTACATSSCAVDYCGLKGAGYNLCLLNDNNGTVTACPTGYTQLVAGKAAGATCGSCGCGVTQGKCTPTLTTFQNAACDTVRDTVDGSCSAVQNFASSKLTITQVDASCTPLAAGSGAALVGKVTICCPQ